MKRIIFTILSTFVSIAAFSQPGKISGTYANVVSGVTVTFSGDATFRYVTREHPTFYRYEDFSENGHWSLSGDTIILNPQLEKKAFVESDLIEEENKGDTNLLLTCNHIKRYIDPYGNTIKTDTLQIRSLDYSFNEIKKQKRVRITAQPTVRCSFAGYIPKEIITANRTNLIRKPAGTITSIFFGCFELQGTKEFMIRNPRSNHLTLNVYSNYYQDGQIRQLKFLIKNANVLYTGQKNNGAFIKDNTRTTTDSKLKRQKSRS
ncbi:MAG: hypothetical protein ABI416_01840 [Ginsengibacter sp.]